MEVLQGALAELTDDERRALADCHFEETLVTVRGLETATVTHIFNRRRSGKAFMQVDFIATNGHVSDTEIRIAHNRGELSEDQLTVAGLIAQSRETFVG